MSHSRLAPFSLAVGYLGCSGRTLRNYVARGYFAAYKVPGVRGLVFDLDEIDAWRASAPARVLVGSRGYGENARIVALPRQSVVVAPVVKKADQ